MNRQIHYSLQLCHIDRIGIIETSSYIRNLAGMGIITYRHSCPGRFPHLGTIRTFIICLGIPAKGLCFRVGNRACTKSHTAFNSSIGIIA